MLQTNGRLLSGIGFFACLPLGLDRGGMKLVEIGKTPESLPVHEIPNPITSAEHSNLESGRTQELISVNKKLTTTTTKKGK